MQKSWQTREIIYITQTARTRQYGSAKFYRITAYNEKSIQHLT